MMGTVLNLSAEAPTTAGHERRGSVKPPPRAVIFGCSGPELSAAESLFFRAADPLGFILFRRNCRTPEQVRNLVEQLRACLDRPDAPILIDQEGGRVARLRPPGWPDHPPAAKLGLLAEQDPAAGRRCAWINARLIAEMLAHAGITVNCAPVCDVPVTGAHDVIGDRAFAHAPTLVADLAAASCAGFLAGGVVPVIKHLPGHGRARSDSHDSLPVIDASLAALEASDFKPFSALRQMPMGMVAHVVYTALDPVRAASVSPTVISEVIRRRIGFHGLLLSDDLAMAALSGSAAERARAVLAAGCDIALHCTGIGDEMAAVAEVVPNLDDKSWGRWLGIESMRTVAGPIDPVALRTELMDRLGSVDG